MARMGIWDMWVYSTVRHWVPCAFRHLAAHVMFHQRVLRFIVWDATTVTTGNTFRMYRKCALHSGHTFRVRCNVFVESLGFPRSLLRLHRGLSPHSFNAPV